MGPWAPSCYRLVFTSAAVSCRNPGSGLAVAQMVLVVMSAGWRGEPGRELSSRLALVCGQGHGAHPEAAHTSTLHLAMDSVNI